MNANTDRGRRLGARHVLRRQPGFTLVELLVVIAIIGILVALLLPAIQAAREAARRSECKNHLKNLGLAMLQHHNTFKHFPTGGWSYKWTGDADRGHGRDQCGSWLYQVLPFIEEQATYNMGSDGEPESITAQQRDGASQRESVVIPLLFCPSRRTADAYPRDPAINFSISNANKAQITVTARSDYAANIGPVHAGVVQLSPHPDSVPIAGNFHWAFNLNELQGIVYAGSKVDIAQIIDGTSKTYMIAEKYLKADAYIDGSDYTDFESAYTGNNDDTLRSPCFVPLQDQPGVGTHYAGWGSAHPGVWQVAMCDGSVQTLTFEIEPLVHEQNGSRAGGACADAPTLAAEPPPDAPPIH